MGKRSLSPKQERFCQEYLIDLNATQAYQRAGYSCTPKSARTEGGKQLAKPDIQARVAFLRKQQEGRTQVTADRVIEELAAIAFTRLPEVATWSGSSISLKDSKALTPAQAAAIQSISITPGKHGDSVIIRLQNKDAALEKLGKYLGMFGDFNLAINALRKYGLELRQTDDGWVVDES